MIDHTTSLLNVCNF